METIAAALNEETFGIWGGRLSAILGGTRPWWSPPSSRQGFTCLLRLERFRELLRHPGAEVSAWFLLGFCSTSSWWKAKTLPLRLNRDPFFIVGCAAISCGRWRHFATWAELKRNQLRESIIIHLCSLLLFVDIWRHLPIGENSVWLSLEYKKSTSWFRSTHVFSSIWGSRCHEVDVFRWHRYGRHQQLKSKQKQFVQMFRLANAEIAKKNKQIWSHFSTPNFPHLFPFEFFFFVEAKHKSKLPKISDPTESVHPMSWISFMSVGMWTTTPFPMRFLQAWHLGAEKIGLKVKTDFAAKWGLDLYYRLYCCFLVLVEVLFFKGLKHSVVPALLIIPQGKRWKAYLKSVSR